MSRDYDEGAAPTESYQDPRREPRRDGLDQRQDRISKEQALMDETLDLLTERMAPILGPERPSPALARLDGSEDAGSDLTRFLEHVSAREAGMVARLRHLVERIDL